MRDPFTELRDSGEPVAPDPGFAAELRVRLERVLGLPRGVTPVTTLTETQPGTAAPPTRSAAIPYLAVADARRAIDWYVDVFGARVVDEPIVMPDGRIGHAELTIGPA